MRNDIGGTGASPSLTAKEILAATRGIEAVTGVETEEWGAFPGPHMTVERMWAVRNRVVEHLARPEVDGVVVTHGTDALEESAYIVARSIPPEKPVVFTGAMRPYELRSTDALQNLIEALIAVQLVAPGVYVAMHNQVLQFPGVTKDLERRTFVKT